MEFSEVLRQVLELDDDGSDWNMSEEEEIDDEWNDVTQEMAALDPLDVAQLDNSLPILQQEPPLDGTRDEEDGFSDAQGTTRGDSDINADGSSIHIIDGSIPQALSTGLDNSLANSDLDATPTSSINPSSSGFSQHVGPTCSLPGTAKPIDYFMLFFDDNLLQLIVDETNLYAQQNPLSSTRYAWYDTTISEIKAFLGLIIMMGIKRLPSYIDYWSSNPLLGTPELVAGFPLNRFRHLLTRIHFNNNNNAPPQGSTMYDKLYKLRPILTALEGKCLTLYNPHRENSIDEAMVGFKGRSSLKQYMPMKPTKRGFKIWCRCDARNGYICSFQVYTGKVEGAVQRDLGSRVVFAVSQSILDKGYHLYFDNYFSSPLLAQNLLERQTFSIATARTNRKHFPPGLTQQAQTLSRGQHVSSQVLDGNVQCFLWKDKKSVAFINTISDPESVTTVARKNSDGSRTEVTCPSAVKLYNVNMGGVDLADQKRKAYSCTRKSTKWYMRLFWFLVDVSIVNAHILESESQNCKKKSQKDFRLELSSHLISCHSSRRKRGRPSDSSPVVRFTERHFPSELTTTRQCKVCSSSSIRKRTKYGCLSCNVKGIHLCPVPCFGMYHTPS